MLTWADCCVSEGCGDGAGDWGWVSGDWEVGTELLGCGDGGKPCIFVVGKQKIIKMNDCALNNFTVFVKIK